MTIYIEGDGLAWLNKSTPSSDPTPINPIGLYLALKHNIGNAAYLARPCQFHNENVAKDCDITLWTNKRFSAEAVDVSDNAIDILKQKFGAEDIQLIGFSGGGAIASLVAAKRVDIVRLVTISGNLNHRLWTHQHHVSPLAGSLNPPYFWEQLQDIPQVHFVGEHDTIMSPDIAYSYQSHFISGRQPKIIVIPNFDHKCCWVKHWPDLLPPIDLI